MVNLHIGTDLIETIPSSHKWSAALANRQSLTEALESGFHNMTNTLQGCFRFTKLPVAAFHGLPPSPPPPNTQWQASQHTDLPTWLAEATEAAELGQSLSQLYLNIDFELMFCV